MEKSKALSLLNGALSEISDSRRARTDDFSGLRDVDAKVREVRMILEGVEGLPSSLLHSMTNDMDFQANSRRVRLGSGRGQV